jgi:hypothetical protein
MVVIIKKNTDALLNASMEIGLEVNSEKTKYIIFIVTGLLTSTDTHTTYDRLTV